MEPTDFRNDAERTLVVTTLSNLEIRRIECRGRYAGRRMIWENVRSADVTCRSVEERLFLSQNFRNPEKLTSADKDVNLRERLSQLLTVALGQTACDNQPFRWRLFLVLRQFENGVDGLFFCFVDEAARVDH